MHIPQYAVSHFNSLSSLLYERKDRDKSQLNEHRFCSHWRIIMVVQPEHRAVSVYQLKSV